MSQNMKFNKKELSTEGFKKWRKDRGLTINEAAELFGYTNISAIYQIESGKRRIPERVLLTMQIIEMGQ